MEFDGKTLKFPTWSETKPIQQAQNQSQWLNKWLSSAIGEVVVVTPVLAIPGWFIKRSAKSNTYIYNGKSPEKLFPKVRHTVLSEQITSSPSKYSSSVIWPSDFFTKGILFIPF